MAFPDTNDPITGNDNGGVIASCDQTESMAVRRIKGEGCIVCISHTRKITKVVRCGSADGGQD